MPLAGGLGTGKPKIQRNTIWFNGVEACGHARRKLGITWPEKHAKGIALSVERGEGIPLSTLITSPCSEVEQLALNDSDILGAWFAGLTLKQRTCGGDCSHETFSLPRKLTKRDRLEPVMPISHYDEQGKPVYTQRSLSVFILISARLHTNPMTWKLSSV